MPTKSKWKKLLALYQQGKITKEELNNYTRGVNYRSLPKKKGKRKDI